MPYWTHQVAHQPIIKSSSQSLIKSSSPQSLIKSSSPLSLIKSSSRTNRHEHARPPNILPSPERQHIDAHLRRPAKPSDSTTDRSVSEFLSSLSPSPSRLSLSLSVPLRSDHSILTHTHGVARLRCADHGAVEYRSALCRVCSRIDVGRSGSVLDAVVPAHDRSDSDRRRCGHGPSNDIR
jgi:hypothetical protein